MDIFSVLPAVGGTVQIIFWFVVALSIIVAVHEYGHYIVGRWSGIDADVFSIGFGPILWSRVDKRGTRWQIAALPFGGYVKFAGDANAASGKDAAAMEAAAADPDAYRRTMHGAPLWARAATVAAGPIFNFIMSAIVFAIVALSTGVVKTPLTVGELRPLPDAEHRLQPGDVLLAVNGIDLPQTEDESFEGIMEAMPKERMLDYTVERAGDVIEVRSHYLWPPLVGGVVPQSAAMDAGLQEGDVITAINGQTVFAFDQLREVVEGSDGAPIQLDIWRNGADVSLTLEPRRVDELLDEGGIETHWRIGVYAGNAFVPARESPSLGEAAWGGVRQVGATIESTLTGLGYMIAGRMNTCNLTGPIRIAQTASEVATKGVADFLWLIALLSTAIGFFNLLPIPVLDGGHLVFHAYEALTGRPPSDRAMQALMITGLAMVLSLMAFALTMDVFCP